VTSPSPISASISSLSNANAPSSVAMVYVKKVSSEAVYTDSSASPALHPRSRLTVSRAANKTLINWSDVPLVPV
jgi:hypothetical protein